MTDSLVNVLAVVVLVAFLIALACSVLGAIQWWLNQRKQRRQLAGPVVPLSVLLEDDSDDLSDAEWAALRDRIPAEFVDYGSSMVHRDCLEARRDGRPVCEHCGPVLAAEREASS